MSELPPDIRDALARNGDATRVFEKLSPSHQREYLRWAEEAKKPETRQKRTGGMMERLAAPKGA
ncbi:YdeI/OmpD-associated family protein [Microvirga flavescens]|uniref:YdeI/OmpD-associated family protein n=1 Tax=Microvirga flavescens TaxID=2249811 RepID=UPI000DD5F214|nr:YdeI/OmpD-associated family protein [Microvirga flavescens]